MEQFIKIALTNSIEKSTTQAIPINNLRVNLRFDKSPSLIQPYKSATQQKPHSSNAAWYKIVLILYK